MIDSQRPDLRAFPIVSAPCGICHKDRGEVVRRFMDSDVHVSCLQRWAKSGVLPISKSLRKQLETASTGALHTMLDAAPA